METIITKAKAGEPLTVVKDVCMSPTYSKDAARILLELIQSNTTGVLHLTNQGSCTWHEFAKAILEMLGLAATVEPSNSGEYLSRARRPKNSSLVSERIEDIVGKCGLRSWKEVLRAYLTEKGHIAVTPVPNLPGSSSKMEGRKWA